MHFITPYILTYLEFFSFSCIMGTFAFIHKDLCELYQISKTMLGFCNGLIALASTIGVIFFLINSVRIKAQIITSFTWGSIGVMFPYILIVLSSIVYDHAPKLILYASVLIIGVFRSLFFQSLLVIIKMHKQIYDRTNHIDEHKYKLLTNLWSPSLGMAAGFFMCNWLQYSFGVRWQILLLITVSMKLLTTTMLFFGLRSYLEDDEGSLVEGETVNTTISTATSLNFFSLVNEHLPTKLFLINSIICESMHIQFNYVLPVFFYASGYQGNQGYLTAIYTISIVVGAYVIAISNYLLDTSKENQENFDKQIATKNESRKNNPIFQFIFSVSLFFCLITLILLTILAFRAEYNKINGVYDDSNITLLMILMCALGFFLGGPLRSYYSYRSIKAMENLEKQFDRRMLTDTSFREKQIRTEQLCSSSESGICDKINGHKLHVGSSLLTTNRIFTFSATMILFVISFYLVDKHLPFTMVFFTLIGITALVFDIIQNYVAVKEHGKQSENSEQMKKEYK